MSSAVTPGVAKSSGLRRVASSQIESINNDVAKKIQGNARAVGGRRPKHSVQQKYNAIESIDYSEPDHYHAEIARSKYTVKMDKKRGGFMWLCFFFVGISVSTIITLILKLCKFIEKARVKATESRLSENDLFGAWLIWGGSMLALNLVACAMCLWQPAASASGIPGLIAFLNGATPPGGKSLITGKKTDFLGIPCLIAKTIGMIVSIPSGLCIGPEGPIIHISAMLGKHTIRLVQILEDRFMHMHHRVGNGELRDFMATGAGCGICTAFHAPLSGVLFVVEEASSFVTVQHIEKTFFASASAYWLGWIMQGAEDDFVKFASPQGPACSLYNSIDLIYFVAMGVFGGVLGSLFNHIVEHLNEHRIEHINKHHWKRVLEVVVVCLLTSVAAVFLPAMFDCVEAERHLMMDDSLGCLAKDYQDQLFRGRIMEEAAYNWMEGDIVMNNTSHPDYEYVSHLNKASKKHTYLGYDAASKHHVQFNYHAHYNCAPHEYNPMAMLWLKGGAYSVKNLFERGMPHLYELNVLIVFLVVYFFLAAISSGIAVPAGLVVPMICIGGSYGRIFGFLNMAVKKKTCAAYMESPFATSTVNSLTMAQWSHEYHSLLAGCGWPDPGSYAVIGAASFMGGSGRITLFLATVMLEVTNDIKMLPPIAFAVILAMWTGNKINHGLYHALIPLAGIPFVNSDPNHIMRYKPVRELMSDTIRTISVNTTYVEIRALIQKDEITHNSFPVVNKDNKLVGLITRSKLSHVLKGDAHLDDDDDETDDMFKHDKIVGGLPVKTKKKKEPVDNSESARKRRRLVLKKMAMKSVLGAAALMKAKKGVDITHYMHRNPITVFTDTKCARAFRIFRSQGYRHLCVIDHKGEPRGMLTRKDLQVYKILEHGGGHGHH